MSVDEFENFSCPYCGEMNHLTVDFSAGRSQEFVVDCEVCCAPIVIRLQLSGDRVVMLEAQRENE